MDYLPGLHSHPAREITLGLWREQHSDHSHCRQQMCNEHVWRMVSNGELASPYDSGYTPIPYPSSLVINLPFSLTPIPLDHLLKISSRGHFSLVPANNNIKSNLFQKICWIFWKSDCDEWSEREELGHSVTCQMISRECLNRVQRKGIEGH